MPNERVVEIPWALSNLPQTGVILDVGSCEATYLAAVPQLDRQLHCLDPRNCSQDVPADAIFFHQSLIGNTLPAQYYDGILVLSTLEHIGLPHYDQKPFENGDRLALAEIRRLLKLSGVAIITVPAGQSKITSWYRQYSSADLHDFFAYWDTDIKFWGRRGNQFVQITEGEVEQYDYNDAMGAGAVAAIIATIP